MQLARIWEKNGHSLPQVANRLPEFSSEIEALRLEKHPDWQASDLEIGQVKQNIRDWCQTADRLSTDEFTNKTRLVRDELFAHSLAGKSPLRKTWKPEHGEPSGPQLSQLKDRLKCSLNLISDLEQIWEFNVVDVDKFIRMETGFVRAYWDALPYFSDVENEELVFEDE